MKKAWVVLILIAGVLLSGCASEEAIDQNRKLIVVGISPMKEWVETIGGDSVQVQVMIPPGNSPANYEPTTRQLLALEEMDRYFAVGVGAETDGFLTRLYPGGDERVIRLDQAVSEVYPDRMMMAHGHGDEEAEETEDQDHAGRDPHIWLSIPRTKVMIQRITEELSIINPDEKESYQNRSEAYLASLEELDQDLKARFLEVSNNHFLLFHPSLGYFADEYGLEMMVIEEDGKSATPSHLMEVIDEAKAKDIRTVFYQEEFDENQAKTIAEELNGDLLPLSILNENYLSGMKEIGEELLKSME
jgi:zinc transport system substrate-binding protein